MAAPSAVAMSDKDIEAMATTSPYAPLTYERRVRDDLERTLPKPGKSVFRSSESNISSRHGASLRNTGSVLQQHCACFDKNDDGIIYPWETYAGLRQIGFNVIVSLIIAIVINVALSYLSLPGWIPSPFFPIYINNMHRDKHGSDSGTYDKEGRYVSANFEFIFSKFARNRAQQAEFRGIMGDDGEKLRCL